MLTDSKIGFMKKNIQSNKLNNVSVDINSGNMKIEAQDYLGAIKDYTELINQDKYNADAYFNRGMMNFLDKII